MKTIDDLNRRADELMQLGKKLVAELRQARGEQRAKPPGRRKINRRSVSNRRKDNRRKVTHAPWIDHCIIRRRVDGCPEWLIDGKWVTEWKGDDSYYFDHEAAETALAAWWKSIGRPIE